MRGWLPKAHRTPFPRQGSFPCYKVYGVLSIISSSRSHKLLGPHSGAGIGIVPIKQMRKQRSGEEKDLLKVTPPPTQFCGPRWGAEEGAGGERRVSLPRHARSRPNGQPFSVFPAPFLTAPTDRAGFSDEPGAAAHPAEGSLGAWTRCSARVCQDYMWDQSLNLLRPHFPCLKARKAGAYL